MIRFRKTDSIFFRAIQYFVLFLYVFGSLIIRPVSGSNIARENIQEDITVAQNKLAARLPPPRKRVKRKKPVKKKAKNPIKRKKTNKKKSKKQVKQKKSSKKKSKNPVKRKRSDKKKSIKKNGRKTSRLKDAIHKTKNTFKKLRQRLVQNKLKRALSGGKISLSKLKSIIPKNTPNKFRTGDGNIKHGQMYEFKMHGRNVRVKFHSPDKNAKRNDPSARSGKMWTAQVKVGNRFLGRDGKFYNKNWEKKNRTHIPVKEFPHR